MKVDAKVTGLSALFTASANIKKQVESEDILKRAAEAFANTLRKNITDQTYGDFGVPHSKRWAEHKQKKNKNPGKYWLYLSTLFKAIRHIRLSKRAYWAGVQSDKKHKGGDPKEYGLILEEHRPLVGNTYEDFKDDWASLFSGTKNKIRAVWK